MVGIVNTRQVNDLAVVIRKAIGYGINSKGKSVGIDIDDVYRRVRIVTYSGRKFNSIE
jgi:hypothetical protein